MKATASVGIAREVRQRLRSSIGRGLQSVAYTSGAMRCSTWFLKHDAGGAVILMYHSVAEGEARAFVDPANHVPVGVFERQAGFLRRHRNVISLSTLVQAMQDGRSCEPGTVVITFDDGYLDNVVVAAPILKRYGLPATLFLATGYLDREESQWVDQAFSAFKYSSTPRIVWGDGSGERHFDLECASGRRSAYAAVCSSLLIASADQRQAMLSRLRDALRPTKPMPRLTMSWDDARRLVADFPEFEIGGHTAEHLDLTGVPSSVAQAELERCRRRIQEQLGIPPVHFSFPYGRTSGELRAAAAGAGFVSACGGGGADAVVRPENDRYGLPRVKAPATMGRFDLLTSTANTGFWRRLGR